MREILLQLDEEDLPPVVEHQPVEFVAAPPAEGALELAVDGLALEPFLRPGDARWRWRWNPGAAAGLHAVALRDAGGARRWQLRAEPRKIDQERYAALIDDLQQVGYGLVASLGGSAAEGAAGQPQPAEGALDAYYAAILGQLPSFERAVRQVAARPHELLAPHGQRGPLDLARQVDPAALARMAEGALDPAPPGVADALQQALRPGGGMLPREIEQPAPSPTHDIYEHRLLGHLLGLLLLRTRQIHALAEGGLQRAGQLPTARAARLREIAQACAAAERSLRGLRALPLLGAVGPLASFHGPTALLQRDPRYRTIYQMWQALRQQPAFLFQSPLLSIPIADLPQLYESWCALQVAAALLAAGGEVRSQRLVRPAVDGDALATVGLATDAPLLVIARGDAELRLRYQPRYRPGAGPTRLRSLDRHTRTPDLSIEVWRAGAAPQALVLDAKYRLDDDGRGVPQDALAEAYAYRGAIGYGGAGAVRRALLLYPGAASELYPSGVGVVAALPGQQGDLARALAEALGEG